MDEFIRAIFGPILLIAVILVALCSVLQIPASSVLGPFFSVIGHGMKLIISVFAATLTTIIKALPDAVTSITKSVSKSASETRGSRVQLRQSAKEHRSGNDDVEIVDED